jgi:hypothetical protein
MQVSSSFVLRKRTKKTFAPLRACETQAGVTSKNQSFFASFCSQKEVLSSLFKMSADGDMCET